MRRLPSIGVVAVMLLASGCNGPAAGTVVTHGILNGYELEYELVAPHSIVADAEQVSITTGKNQIRIADGKLNVDGGSYGMVKPKDRISVVGGKVSVNDRERKPDA